MNDNTRTIIAALAAGVTGFALGMMLAPKKGSDLRTDVLDSLEDLSCRVNDILDEGRAQLQAFASGSFPGSRTDTVAGNYPHKQSVS